ncbi:MAG TPA: 4'-phosphopantetheinyl transferase superfamily protein [Bryobacteraceae bacterium]|nr:4'-phosphopantetheinyl transferase superfamily protein [Bryobacteraceae bacterium]
MHRESHQTAGIEMWRVGPAPEMKAGEVHAWLADLNPSAAFVQQLAMTLSDDEQHRASRFHFERDRRRFVVARGTLRLVLAEYLKRPPEEIQFFYEPAGKPYLRCSGSEPKVQFNVSHSQDTALIGICLEHRIGIDIEFKDPDRATLEVARLFFAPEEIAALADLPAKAQCDTFFAIWAMKEAYIKGRGEGVSLGLDTFAVTVDRNGRPTLLRSSHGKDETKRWRFWTIDAGSAYAAALAVEGAGDRRLSFWRAAFPGQGN